MMPAPYILVIILIAAAALSFLISRLLRPGRRPHPMDTMEGHDFEYYCAGILKDKGFTDVEVTKGSGDFGVDILAVKDGVTYAVQCKCYDKPIGVKAVQEIYAGRDYYGRMVGIVMTNRDFTRSARELADKLNILLWDRSFLEQ